MSTQTISLSISRPTVVKVLISLAYAALISWLYINEVATTWGYQGFGVDYSAFSAVIIIFATSMVAAAMPNEGDTRSMLLMLTHFLFFVPSIVFAFISGAHLTYIALLFSSIAVIIPLSGLAIKPIRTSPIRRSQFLPFLIISSFIFVVLYALLGNIRSLNFDLSAVYAVRAENVESLPGFLGYFVSLISAIMLPMAMIYSLATRNYVLLGAAIGLQLVFFGMTNFKNILFSPLLIIFIYLFAREPSRRLYLPYFFFGLPIAAMVNFLISRIVLQSEDLLFVVNNFIRRLLFAPPLLDNMHIQFFSENALYYWSTSRITFGLVESPYSQTAPFVIGLEFFQFDTWAANTGIIGSGYSNAGAFGVLLYATLFGLLLALLNSYGKHLGHAFVTSLGVLTVMNITRSSDFVTVLLTHGLVFLIALLAVTPKEN